MMYMATTDTKRVCARVDCCVLVASSRQSFFFCLARFVYGGGREDVLLETAGRGGGGVDGRTAGGVSVEIEAPDKELDKRFLPN